MIINENNIDESFRVLERLEGFVLKDLGKDGEYLKSGENYAGQKLSCLAEIFVCLEMNDRYANPVLNKPSEKQLAYAYDLAKNMKDNAKTALAEMGKKTIDELTKDEISVFIKKLTGRP